MIETVGSRPQLADGTVVPISPAIRAGKLLFISGQLGLDDNGELVSADAELQVRQCIKRLQEITDAAGAGLERIVKANIWVTDKGVFPTVNRVWAEFFQEQPPARSTVVSELLIPGAVVEVDAIAVIADR